MKNMRYLLVLPFLLLGACGGSGGFSTSSKVEVTDKNITPDNPVTIKQTIIGYLSLQNTDLKIDKINGKYSFVGQFNLVDDDSKLLSSREFALSGAAKGADDGASSLYPAPGSENANEQTRARITCLENDIEAFCRSMIVDFYLRTNGQVYATQITVELDSPPAPTVDEDDDDQTAINPDEAEEENFADDEAHEHEGMDEGEDGGLYVGTLYEDTQKLFDEENPVAEETSPPKKEEQKPTVTEDKSAAVKKEEPKSQEQKSDPAPTKPAEPKQSEQKSTPPKPAEPKATPAPVKPVEPKQPEKKPTPAPAPAKPVEQKSQDEKSTPTQSKPSESKAPEQKPATAKPVEPKQSEQKPTPTKPTEQKTQEPKSTPALTKPVEPKKSEQKPAPAKPTEKKSLEKSTPAPAKPAPQPKVAVPSPRPEPTPTAPATRKRDQAIGLAYGGRLENSTNLVEAIKDQKVDHIHVLYPSRKRHYGTHELVQDLIKMSTFFQQRAPGDKITVGDLSQRRGGKLVGSQHKSHQNGLDVDISFPRKHDKTPAFADIVRGRGVTSEVRLEETYMLLEYAHVSLQAVDRIFAATSIKRAMCSMAKSRGMLDENDKGRAAEVLRRIRPEDGHRKHFHLRIRCSTQQPRCRMMAEPPSGSGCRNL